MSGYGLASTAGTRPVGGSGRDLDEAQVGEFLLAKKYHLVALELHQELLEANNGVHNVAALNRFFNDGTMFENLVRTTENKAREAKAKGKVFDERLRARSEPTCRPPAVQRSAARSAPSRPPLR